MCSHLAEMAPSGRILGVKPSSPWPHHLGSNMAPVVSSVDQTRDDSDHPDTDGVSLVGILSAAQRIKPFVHMTPVLTCQALDEMSGGRNVFFKCELFQKTGSFKARGACNAVLQVPQDCKDVVTHSSGNHGQAVAWASKIRGMDAHVVMWSNSRPVKVAAVRDYGASVTFCEPVKFAREKTTEAILSRMPNAAFIPSSNDPKVICGQGTLGLEFVEQVKRLCGSSLDAIIVPIGGGGMISGVTTAVKSLCPGIRVIGAEPAEADDAYRSKMSGELCSHKGPDEPQTIADGLKIHLASKAWPVVRDKVDEIVTVSEEEIKRWMKVVYERMKLAIEPSAAVGVAALMSPQVRSLPPSIKKIGVVICGGNVDMASLRDAFA